MDLVRYRPARGSTAGIHPWVADFETKAIRGEAAFRAALALQASGYAPDAIIAHPAWGESLFLKEVWPEARLGIYCEFFYRARGADKVAPDPAVRLVLPDGTTLKRDDEVVTFVNRNLEPYRGYHVFMRALPELLARRPRARVLIVGDNDVSYGARPPAGRTWKQIFLDEVRERIAARDLRRVHFVGQLPYPQFIGLLQLSTGHVYLTYPFVLSWSLLEAMSAGCAIVASDTQPLREAIRHGHTGRLVDFFNVQGLAQQVCELLDHPQERTRLGENARAFARAHYDLRTVCLPRQLDWVERLVQG